MADKLNMLRFSSNFEKSIKHEIEFGHLLSVTSKQREALRSATYEEVPQITGYMVEYENGYHVAHYFRTH